MPERNVNRTPTGRFTKLAIIATMASLLLLWAVDRVVADQRRASEAVQVRLTAFNEILLKLEAARAPLIMVAAAGRGFAVTGNIIFASRFERARQEENATRAEITAALPNEWRQTTEYRELVDISDGRERYLHRLSGAIAVRDRARAAAIVTTLEGEDQLAAISTILASFEARAVAERKKMLSAVQKEAQKARQLMAMLEAFLFLIIVSAAFTAIRALAARQLALDNANRQRAGFQAIFDNASDAIVVFNQQGRVASANREALLLFGYDLQTFLGREALRLVVDGRDDGGLPQLLSDSLRGKASATFSAMRADGARIPVEATVSLYDDPSSMERHYLVLLRDVTERQRLETMKSEFVSTVSHELRTPLTSIAGSLGLLSGGAAGHLPESVGRLIGIAHTNCRRLIRLINDMLDIEKMEAGKMDFDIRPLPLAPLIGRAVSEMKGYIEGASIEYSIAPENADAAVLADEDRLLQVLINLLSNAAKFSPPRGTVDIAVVRKGEYWRILVTDYGAGIPHAFQHRIFGKFAQGDASDKRVKGGTGLGLAIVKQIVEGIGGDVSFYSEPDKRTTFCVDLPAVSVPDGRAAASVEGKQDIASILHVDDDGDVLRIMAAAFGDRASLTSVVDLRSARTAIAKLDFDAAIIDVVLPDGNGLDLAAELRRVNPRIKIIAFTAHEVDTEHRQIADFVITKSRDELGYIVNEVLKALNDKGSVPKMGGLE